MHILIIPSEIYVPEESPLSGIFQQDQARALRRAGHSVGVVTSHLRSPFLIRKKLFGWPSGVTVEDDRGIPVYRYNGWHWTPLIRPVFPQATVRHFLKTGIILIERYVAERGVPDIIHAHNAVHAGILAERVKKRFHIPYVITEHSSSYARKLVRDSEIPFIKEAFQNADRRLFVSPSLGRHLEKMLPEHVSPWEWVPNILDELFEKNPPEARRKKRPDEPFFFLNVGALIEIKGQADLLKAFARAFKGKREVQLRIAGQGPLKNQLRSLSNELGIINQVFFLGELSRSQVLEEMQNCDAYVHASHYETFGVVIIEALACGKPVISPACGGPEFLVTGENGVLVPPGEIEALGNAMTSLHRDIDRYDPARIRTDCVSKYGERNVVETLTKIYEQILSRHSGSV
jgi:glycosyltransferase involved in cell wall biosynthesis